MKNLLNAVFAAITAALLCFAPLAMAQTPDGETPAEEDVCSVLAGGTPGLYGLCTAYCEAQDADIAFFSNDILGKTSHQKLLDNYNKKKKDSDPDMPCLRGACPCFNANDVAAIGNDRMSADCRTEGDTYGTYYGTDEDGCRGNATLKTYLDGATCFYRNDNFDPTNPKQGCFRSETQVVENLTPFEAAACVQAISDGAALAGVTCRVSLPPK